MKSRSQRQTSMSIACILFVSMVGSGCAVQTKSVQSHRTSRISTDDGDVETSSRAPQKRYARSYGGMRAPRSAAPSAKSLPYRSHRRMRTNSDLMPRRRTHRRRRTRRGLGTSYGESLYAPVHEVSFTRASHRPSRTIRIHYNDASGVRAMARQIRRYRTCCRPVPYVSYGGVSVQLVDTRGRAFSGMRWGGRTLVIGRHNRRYQIRVRNHTGRTIEAVISVDGLDVIDGKRATTEKRGYLIRPHATLCLKGFRRSYTHVAAFRFSSIRRSYAKRMTGSSRNVGVIGVAVFYGAQRSYYNSRKRWAASPFQY